MSEAKFTKGPWRLNDPVHDHVIDDTYHVIDAGSGCLEAGGFSLSGLMSAYDARLIASAPELLNALEYMVALRDAFMRGEIIADKPEQIEIPKVRAILAKARGEP